jgi:hypothetical protein
MRNDYFYQSGSCWNVGWYGSGNYHFDTLEEAKGFAKYWGVHIPLNLCNSNA